MAGSTSGFIGKTVLALVVAASIVGIAQADINTARTALAANDFSGAITALDEVLEQSPEDQEARFLKGLALARSGDTDGALTVFNALVEDRPEMAEAWNNLGVLRARKGNLTSARDALQQAIRVDPQHGPAQENLGDIYVALARNAYSRAGELEPDNAIARAKSQQLATFLGDSQGGSQVAGNTQSANSGSAAAATPPPLANVSQNAQDQPVRDIRTPQAALQSWAKAWSAQNVAAYLAMYSDRFVPDDGSSRASWATERRERVATPSRIDVSLSDVQITRRGNQALARFSQRYRSNTYQDRERKALLFGESSDGWQILREGKAESVDFTVAADAEKQSPGGQSSQAGASDGDTLAQPMHDDVTSPATQSRANASADTAEADTASVREPAAGQRSAPAELQAASQVPAIRQAVRKALQGWAQAWSRQDLQAYLNAYSDNYRPRDGKSRTAWVRNRQSAVTAPGWIKIELSDMRVSLLSNDRAQASFNQHYRSKSYDDRERKRVTLIHEDGGWRIVRES